jgi:hypothetical protein
MVRGGISISDNRATAGKLLLRGAGWDAEFRKQEGLLVISFGKKVVKILPFDSQQKKSEKIASCEVIEDDKNKRVEIRAIFSAGDKRIEGSFLFGLKGAIEVRPRQNMEGVSIFSEMSYGVVPSLILDDIIYEPNRYSSATQLYIPSENLFIGLLRGQDGMLICAWPSRNQRPEIVLGNDRGKDRLIQAVKIKLQQKSIYLSVLTRPGIWHKEELLPSYLEKDVQIAWKRPFSAKWKTHLNEINKIKTAFAFIDKRNRRWRPRIGWYIYPVWFDGEKTMLHTGKKIPPTGEALIYAMEGRRDTPVEFAREHLGFISNLKPKRRLQRYPKNNAGFRNCDGRNHVKKIFKEGLHVKKKRLLQKVMSDFLYSINKDKRRLEQYVGFIRRMNEKIELWSKEEKDSPELQSFFRQMKNNVEGLDEEYRARMGGKTASEYLRHETEAIYKLKGLFNQKGTGVHAEASRLLDEIRLWSLMEEVPGSVGALMREWARQAGHRCSDNIAAVEYAEEIRREIREFIGTGATYETIY